MRFIHAADIHLDSPLAGLREKAGSRAGHLADASRKALEALVDYALAEKIDLVVVAGDVFDRDSADYNSVLFLIKQLSRLAQADIPVALIRGNHDALNQMSKQLIWPPNVHEFSSRAAETYRLPALRVAVHGRSFPERRVTENLVPGYPQPVGGWFNIGLLHSSADGRPGHDDYAPCTLQDLRTKGYEYWALGHVHGWEVLCQEPHAVFSGNLQGRHANECGAKGFAVVTVEAGRVRDVEHVAVDVVRWAKVAVDVSGAQRLEDICPLVSRALRDAAEDAGGRTLAARIVLTGACSAHFALAGDPARLLAECSSLVVQSRSDIWIERVVVETRTEALGDDAAFDDLAKLLGRISGDEAEAASIVGSLSQCVGRVPAEIREQVGLLDLALVRERLMVNAQAAILHRLASTAAPR